MKINFDEKQLEFISNTALLLNGVIAKSEINLSELSEILSFLISVYGINAPLNESDKSVLRQCYKIIQKNVKLNEN